MKGWGLFFFLLFILVIIAIGAWVGYTQYTARKRGVPAPSWRYYIPFVKDPNAGSTSNYPSPRHAGVIEWIKGQIDKMRNKRTARGAYEETGAGRENLYSGAGRGGRRDGGGGGEDDAWDTRVGSRDDETFNAGGDRGAYSGYEEQELGLAPTPGVGGDNSYGGGRGQSEYMGADTSYGGVGGTGGRLGRENPFSDENQAPSLRSISPRPAEERGHKTQDSVASDGSHKKSAFREGI